MLRHGILKNRFEVSLFCGTSLRLTGCLLGLLRTVVLLISAGGAAALLAVHAAITKPSLKFRRPVRGQ